MRATWLGLGPLEFLLLTFWRSIGIQMRPFPVFQQRLSVGLILSHSPCVSLSSRGQNGERGVTIPSLKYIKKCSCFRMNVAFLWKSISKTLFFLTPPPPPSASLAICHLAEWRDQRDAVPFFLLRWWRFIHVFQLSSIAFTKWVFTFISSFLQLIYACIAHVEEHIRYDYDSSEETTGTGEEYLKELGIGSWNGLMAFSYNFLYLPVFYDISIQLDTVMEFSLSLHRYHRACDAEEFAFVDSTRLEISSGWRNSV